MKKPIAHIYNPANQSKEELIRDFVIRGGEFKLIRGDLADSKPDGVDQHYLVQGVRGTGKTTLLLRLAYEIERDETLRNMLYPVIFSEEQYHIYRLEDLWIDILERLAEETLLADHHETILEALETREGQALLELMAGMIGLLGRKVVLFIDNIGDLFAKFKLEERQQLREVLITFPGIRVIGASAMMLEHTYDHGEPFYNFFKLIHLEGLKQKDTRALLNSLGQFYGLSQAEKETDDMVRRIEPLRRISGGIPRTMVLLYEIYMDDAGGDSFRDLEVLLDKVTPLYKHRMDDMSDQQKKIVHAMAFHWDAVSTGELADATRLKNNIIAAQLKSLIKNRVVNKITTNTKNNLYQITCRIHHLTYRQCQAP